MTKLPFKVNRTAVKRVLNHLPTPTACPYCGGAVKIVNNAEIYGAAYGKWPWMYACEKKGCDAHVGMHPETAIPLGTLARKELREARKSAKNLFQGLWMNGGMMNRTEAYSWLADKMNIPYAACHFGWFTIEQCAEATTHLKKFLRIEDVPEKTKAEILQDF